MSENKRGGTSSFHRNGADKGRNVLLVPAMGSTRWNDFLALLMISSEIESNIFRILKMELATLSGWELPTEHNPWFQRQLLVEGGW